MRHFIYLMHVWDHRQSNHPNQTPNFYPKPKEMVLALLAEQNIDTIEEVEMLKRDMKGSLIEFSKKMQACFEVLANDIKDTSKNNQAALADLTLKMNVKMNDYDDKTNVNEEKVKDDKRNNDCDEKAKQEGTKHAKEKSSNKKDEFNQAWVGTSISKALDVKKFEKENRIKVKVVKAYSIKQETKTPFPKDNFRSEF